MINVRLLAGGLALSITSLCCAGDAGGPNVVWVNLGGEDGVVVDEMISAIVQADTPMCWDAFESHIYMKRHPKGLSNELARKALVGNDPVALRKLNSLLASYHDEYTTGLDGVIAYVPGKPSRMIGLTTGRLNRDIDAVDPKGDLNAIEASFCMVMSETVRKP